ncbi:hypothetical protein SPRG_17245 [Saprolegnia parasitica CBS 223.65]|uniref:Uncharacterized protein n=1 Tax=Saprolegnia parasitica (strain CBS 223.65) TaxID=695850 RepID=A0A067BFB7_SAPPC|nr:hypothetical protein SPRG_17245 [Saprolegnia parasitica CBS 223.65]KDO17074.1 hypothetical protein SPRG_17245 [Saprolegnia parasitica CBS 223.65]|eukprot:XP_012212219.1 hypothetical protein SPRG_17245 [Saprolegnia parasitica CBS 223.65]
MPAFPGLYVACNSVSDRWPVPQGSAFASPFCAFVAQWAHKVERFDETFRITVTDAQGTEFSRLLLLCTNVKAVTLYNDNGADLRTILKAPYRISELHLIDFDDSNSGTRDDWAVPVMQWLALDRAFRLGLSGCKSHHDADVARAIASAPALSTLHLNDCDVICAGLVANALPLCHVTELVLDATLERLAPLLDISKLTTLELCGDGNELLACSLGALQTCSALEHLSLDHVAVYGPALRTREFDAKLRSVRVVSSDLDASIFETTLD